MVVEDKLKEELMKETILNTLSELVLYQDKENRIMWANRAAGDSVGLAPEQLAGRFCYEVCHQRSEPCEGCPVVRARETGQSEIAEITSPDGRVWLIRGYPVRSENGEILGVIEITLDITERKRAEDALRESENKFRDLAEKSFVGIYLIQDGVLKYVNPRLAEIFEYEVEEIKEKKNVRDLTLPEDWPIVEENIRKRISGEVKSVHYVLRGITKNKDTIWVEVYGSRTMYQGRPAVIGALLDITKRKLVEQALHLSEEKFRTMIEQSNDMIWTLDTEGSFTFFNKRCEEVSGHRFEDWQGKTFEPLILEEYIPWVIEAFRRTLDGEPQHYEVGVRKKDGEILLLSVNTAPVFVGHEVVGTVSFGRDVTEQKRAEEKLMMEAQLLDTATDSIMVYDFDGNCIFANEAAYKSRGFSKDELMRLNLRDSLTPEYANLIELWIKKLTETGEATLECAVFCKNRSTMPIEVHARIIESGGRKLILGVARDITKRKQAEQELRTSLEKLSGGI